MRREQAEAIAAGLALLLGVASLIALVVIAAVKAF